MTVEFEIEKGRNRGDIPFTLEDLFAAHPLIGWGYREVWAHRDWALVDVQHENDYFCSIKPEHEPVWNLRARWAEETGRKPSNHQSFLVRTPNEMHLFVLFHDNRVFIGQTAREEEIGFKWGQSKSLSVEDALANYTPNGKMKGKV